MNKQGKNGIGWTDYTWNPITGCSNGCEYCYANRLYKRFKKSFRPSFHVDRLSEPLNIEKPSKIFACSTGDLYCNGALPLWREEVYNIMSACARHTFQILTKCPYRIYDFQRMPSNLWLGVSVTSFADEWRRFYISRHTGVKFISFEPLIDEVFLNLRGIDWVIIGAMTGPGSQNVQPKLKWVESIVKEAKKRKVPVFMKRNLSKVWKRELIRQFP